MSRSIRATGGNPEITQTADRDSALAVAEVQREAASLDMAIRATQVKMARKSFPHFCEFVLKDPQRNKLRLAPVHNCWIEHITNNYRPNARIGVLAPWHHGKCCRQGTLIQMADGSRKPIEQVSVGDSVISLEESTMRPVPQTVVATKSAGWLPLVRIRFISGRVIECTQEHPFLTVKGWQPLSALSEGSMVASANFVAAISHNDLSIESAEILGFMLGDGCCGYGGSNLASSDSGVSKRFLSCCRTIGLDPHLNERRRRVYMNSHSNRHKASAIDFLRKYGLAGKTSYSKRVPEEVFRASSEVISAFVGAYFSCDGCVCHQRTSSGIPTSVEFNSVSRDLLLDVQDLLLRLGVMSVLRSKNGRYKGSVHRSWRLCVLASNVSRLVRQMPVYHSERAKAVARIPLNDGDDSVWQGLHNSKLDKIPKDWVKLLPASPEAVCSAYFGKYGRRVSKDDRQGPTKLNPAIDGHNRQTVKWFAKLANSASITRLCSESIFWDKIVSIKSVPSDETFDLQLDGWPNFLANGIYVHNSTIASIAFVLFTIGRRPSSRVAIISNTDDEAMKRLKAIGEYIEKDDEYHAVFPWVKPDPKGPWSGHQLKINRRAISIEPTVEATGIDGTVMGSHYDLMVFDDPIDNKDAESVVIRDSRKQKFFQAFMSRPAPGGIVLIICTRWCVGDLVGELIENEEYGFKFIVQAVSEDYKRIEQPPAHYKIFPAVTQELPATLPLWTPDWGEEQLREREKSITRRGFARGFRQIPFADEDFVFTRANIDAVCDWDSAPEDLVDQSWPKFTGVDLAGEKRPGTVIFTFAVAPGGKKYLWEIRRGSWGFGTRAAEQVIAAYEHNKPEIIIVENNASQQACVDILKLIGAPWMPVKGYCTGREKADIAKGIPGLQVQVENRGWVFPMGHVASHRGKTCDCPYCVFLSELRQYPHGMCDTVLAWWLSERGFASGEGYEVDLDGLNLGGSRGKRTFGGQTGRIFGGQTRRVFTPESTGEQGRDTILQL